MPLVLDIGNCIERIAAGESAPGRARRLQKDIHEQFVGQIPLAYPYPLPAADLEDILGALGEAVDVCVLYWMLSGLAAPSFTVFDGFTPLRAEEMIGLRQERIDSTNEEMAPRDVFIANNLLPIFRRDAELISVFLARPPITRPTSVIFYSDETWTRCTAIYRHFLTFINTGAAREGWLDGVIEDRPYSDMHLFPALADD